MAKDFELTGDASLDNRISAYDTKTVLVGNDLASRNGVDLNNTPDTGNIEKNIEKTGIGTRIGALFQLPLAVTGSQAYAPNEYADGIMNEPVAGFHQVHERPPGSSEFGQISTMLNYFGGKEYDDGKFDPSAQIEAGELGTAFNQPVAADHADPPNGSNIELGGLNETILDNEVNAEQIETEVSADDLNFNADTPLDYGD